MRWVEPKVFKLGETALNRDGLVSFLRELGADVWMEKQPWYSVKSADRTDEGSVLIEIAGRTCYKSFGLGLNPNITKIREDSREYVANVLKKGDGSIFEHSSVSWAFVDVSRIFCYSDDTEVLTNEGWKPWPVVRGDELFASIKEGGELMFEPAEEHFVAEYAGPMYHVRSQQIDLLVTPDHRMWVQPSETQAYRRGEQDFGFHIARSLLHRQVRYWKGGLRWKGEDAEVVSLPGTERRWHRKDAPGTETVRDYEGASFPAEAYARFLGFYIAEGHLGNPDTSISLTQNPGPILDEMTDTVRSMGLRTMEVRPGEGRARRLTFKNVALYDWLRHNCGNGALVKRVPMLVDSWSTRLISRFLDALTKGDGNIHKGNGHRVIYTSSKQLADDLQVLALKAGVAANIRVDGRVGSHRIYTGAVIRKTLPNYIVSFLSKTTLFPHVNDNLRRPWPNRYRIEDGYDDRLVYYSGKVYCVKVPHGLLYVRRDGKACWSGNTHELVRHRAGTAISQESLRYVRPKELKMTMVPGSELSRLDNLDELTRSLDVHQEEYLRLAKDLIHAEMRFDDKKAWTSALRRILPDGMATNIVWTANHRTLRWVLEMRTAPGAEVEMRYVFDKVGQIVKRDYPLLYGDFERTPHADGIGGQWSPKLRSKV